MFLARGSREKYLFLLKILFIVPSLKKMTSRGFLNITTIEPTARPPRAGCRTLDSRKCHFNAREILPADFQVWSGRWRLRCSDKTSCSCWARSSTDNSKEWIWKMIRPVRSMEAWLNKTLEKVNFIVIPVIRENQLIKACKLFSLYKAPLWSCGGF